MIADIGSIFAINPQDKYLTEILHQYQEPDLLLLTKPQNLDFSL
jgi:hypothetical protein